MNLRTRLLIAVGGAALIIAIVLLRLQQASGPSAAEQRGALRAGCGEAQRLYSSRSSNVWVTASAHVSQVLPDAHGRFVHQRFIVRCAARQTILIVNDISIGQRVPERAGDEIAVRGQYVWNRQGGLIHFTHHDPQGSEGGWILDNGHVYR